MKIDLNLPKLSLISGILLFFTLAMTPVTNADNVLDQPAKDAIFSRDINSIPITFAENMGQWDTGVKFRTASDGATVWFSSEGAHFQFTRLVSNYAEEDLSTVQNYREFKTGTTECLIFKSVFVGAKQNADIVGGNRLPYKTNYFFNNDPQKWYTDVPNYEFITYRNVYDGIDLKFYGRDRLMEYDFIGKPLVELPENSPVYEAVAAMMDKTLGL